MPTPMRPLDQLATDVIVIARSPTDDRASVEAHAYIHLVEVGGPVTVGGLTVNPGDLLHADQHGALRIPDGIADQVADAAQAVEDRERITINYAKSEGFTSEGLLNL